MHNEFRKDKLSNGCIVQLKNKEKYIYLQNIKCFNSTRDDIFLNINNFNYLSLNEYTYDLYHGYNKNYTVIKICDKDFVGLNLEQHLKNGQLDTDEWTAVRDENEEELDVDKLLKEIKIKLKEFNKILERYEELKDREVER